MLEEVQQRLHGLAALLQAQPQVLPEVDVEGDWDAEVPG
jgi:hypothetical protein